MVVGVRYVLVAVGTSAMAVAMIAATRLLEHARHDSVLSRYAALYSVAGIGRPSVSNRVWILPLNSLQCDCDRRRLGQSLKRRLKINHGRDKKGIVGRVAIGL